MMHAAEQRDGTIVTFYSYKGGTGRTMALANVAWILASAGKKVLVVDWDLEAPGLHRYFAPFLLDKELTSSEGMIDFVSDFAVDMVTPDESVSPRNAGVLNAHAPRGCPYTSWWATSGNGPDVTQVPTSCNSTPPTSRITA